MYLAVTQDVTVILIDYTGGYFLEQREPFFQEKLQNRLTEISAYTQGIPICIFQRQPLHTSQGWILEKTSDTAQRVMEIFSQVYHLGKRQRGLLYHTILYGLESYDVFNIYQLIALLKENRTSRGGLNPCAAALLEQLSPLADKNLFLEDAGFDWPSLLYGKGQLIIFQISYFSIGIQKMITSLLLWDLFYGIQRFGKKENPFIIVLDECRNLQIGTGTPVMRLLTEGRKFGAGIWLATQSKEYFQIEERIGLEQVANRIYFKPPVSEINKIADSLGNGGIWRKRLSNMPLGTCVISGTIYTPNGFMTGNVIAQVTAV